MPDKERESLKKMVDEALKQRRSESKGDFEPFPPTLQMKIGDTVELLIIRQVETAKYGIARIVVDREGNQWSLPRSTAIVRELIKAKAGVGDFLYIHFESEVPNRKNPTYNPFKNYEIVVISKENFERTGDKFPTPKPVAKPASPTSASQIPSGAATQAPTSTSPSGTPASGDMAKLEEVVKRLADMSVKVGGLRKEEFEKMTKNMTGTALTADEIALMFSGLVKIDGASGKVLKA